MMIRHLNCSRFSFFLLFISLFLSFVSFFFFFFNFTAILVCSSSLLYKQTRVSSTNCAQHCCCWWWWCKVIAEKQMIKSSQSTSSSSSRGRDLSTRDGERLPMMARQRRHRRAVMTLFARTHRPYRWLISFKQIGSLLCLLLLLF